MIKKVNVKIKITDAENPDRSLTGSVESIDIDYLASEIFDKVNLMREMLKEATSDEPV